MEKNKLESRPPISGPVYTRWCLINTPFAWIQHCVCTKIPDKSACGENTSRTPSAANAAFASNVCCMRNRGNETSTSTACDSLSNHTINSLSNEGFARNLLYSRSVYLIQHTVCGLQLEHTTNPTWQLGRVGSGRFGSDRVSKIFSETLMETKLTRQLPSRNWQILILYGIEGREYILK